MNVFSILLFATIVIFTFASGVNSFGQKRGEIQIDFSKMIQAELISNLASLNEEEATKSAIEIFRRGETSIPSLLQLKGHRQGYVGYCLGDTNGADSVGLVENEEGSIVTVEVVALYLISAIYYDNLAFANVPYLTGKERVRGNSFNTRKRVKKAWKASNDWYGKLQKIGLEKLRQGDVYPLKSTDVFFTGTNPLRKREISDCGQ